MIEEPADDPITAFRAKLSARIKYQEDDFFVDEDLVSLMRDLDKLFAEMQPIWRAVVSTYRTQVKSTR